MITVATSLANGPGTLYLPAVYTGNAATEMRKVRTQVAQLVASQHLGNLDRPAVGRLVHRLHERNGDDASHRGLGVSPAARQRAKYSM